MLACAPSRPAKGLGAGPDGPLCVGLAGGGGCAGSPAHTQLGAGLGSQICSGLQVKSLQNPKQGLVGTAADLMGPPRCNKCSHRRRGCACELAGHCCGDLTGAHLQQALQGHRVECCPIAVASLPSLSLATAPLRARPPQQLCTAQASLHKHRVSCTAPAACRGLSDAGHEVVLR